MRRRVSRQAVSSDQHERQAPLTLDAGQRPGLRGRRAHHHETRRLVPSEPGAGTFVPLPDPEDRDLGCENLRTWVFGCPACFRPRFGTEDHIDELTWAQNPQRRGIGHPQWHRRGAGWGSGEETGTGQRGVIEHLTAAQGSGQPSSEQWRGIAVAAFGNRLWWELHHRQLVSVQRGAGGKLRGGRHHRSPGCGLRRELVHRETGCRGKAGRREEAAVADGPGADSIRGGCAARAGRWIPHTLRLGSGRTPEGADAVYVDSRGATLASPCGGDQKGADRISCRRSRASPRERVSWTRSRRPGRCSAKRNRGSRCGRSRSP